jgi:hypothetical protein
MSIPHARERRSESFVLVFFDSFSARFDRSTISMRFRPVDNGSDKEGQEGGMKVGCSSAVFPLNSTEMKSKSRIGGGGGRI